MEQDNNILDDYSDTQKTEVYDDIMQNLPTGKHLGAYNVKRLMPDVKGKIVLDLPCGNGPYVRELFHLGVTKVVAGDIVPQQLEVSKEKDKKAGIPDGFVEYHEIDARTPKRIGSELADVCLSLHLFCMADNEHGLRGMVQTILTNLKPGGCCLIVTCFLSSDSNDEQKVRSKLESTVSDEKLVQLDPPNSDKFIPRRYHTVQLGFHFNRYFIHTDIHYSLIPTLLPAFQHFTRKVGA